MKALLIARRELGDLVGDRSFMLGLVFLGVGPLLFVNIVGGNRIAPVVLLVFAIQSALFPTFMTANVAASTFIQDKESQTLLPLLAAPVRDSQILAGKLVAIFIPAAVASWAALAIFYVAASIKVGAGLVSSVITPGIVYSIMVLSGLLVLTLGCWTMVVASRVRTARTAQQISGLIIAALYGLFAVSAPYLFDAAGGWLFLALPLAILAADVGALELARRLWGREEVIARI
jgi:ABC-type Na+ efflux pump permease subunit